MFFEDLHDMKYKHFILEISILKYRMWSWRFEGFREENNHPYSWLEQRFGGNGISVLEMELWNKNLGILHQIQCIEQIYLPTQPKDHEVKPEKRHVPSKV